MSFSRAFKGRQYTRMVWSSLFAYYSYFSKLKKKITCLSELFFHQFIFFLLQIEDDLFFKFFLHFLSFIRIVFTDSFDLASLFKIRVFFIKFSWLASPQIILNNLLASLLLLDKLLLVLVFRTSLSRFFVPMLASTPLASLLISAMGSLRPIAFVPVVLLVFFLGLWSLPWMLTLVLFLLFGVVASWTPKVSNKSNELHEKICWPKNKIMKRVCLTCLLCVFSSFCALCFIICHVNPFHGSVISWINKWVLIFRVHSSIRFAPFFESC